MKRINWIILLCVFLSIFSWYLPSNEYEAVLRYLAFSGDNLLSGRVWTPITALFLHADFMHLAGNILFLFVFGHTLEGAIGSKKTLTAFFTGGILSFLLSVYFYPPEIPMIGASAAIFTLTAIVMLVKPLKFSLLFLMPQGLVAILYFVYNVAAVYFDVQGNVAFISHILGFFTGIPFGITWSRDWKRNLVITLALLILFYILQGILLHFL
jgi:membrane associated rhomboid family serine protease